MRKTACALMSAAIALSLSLVMLSARAPITMTLDAASITDPTIRRLIEAMVLSEENGGWALYVNNGLIATAVPQGGLASYGFELDGTVFKVEADIAAATVNISYTYPEPSTIDTLIELRTVGGVQTLTVYPAAAGDDEPYVLQGRIDGDRTSFDGLTLTYRYRQAGVDRTMAVKYGFSLDMAAGRLYVTANGEPYEIVCQTGQQSQKVFLEVHVDAHLLAVDYLAKLSSYKDFIGARDVPYDSAEIARIVRNEILTLVSSRTGLSTTESLQEYIDYWKRVGKEDYDLAVDGRLQVVCQWSDQACAEIRAQTGEADRTYAVFGASYDFQAPYFYNTLEYRLAPEYGSWSEWMDQEEFNDRNDLPEPRQTERQEFMTYDLFSDWSEAAYTYQQVTDDDTHRSTVEYGYRQAAWDEWSEFVHDEQERDDCQDDQDCQWRQAVMYRRSTSSWGAWSSYSTADDRVDCRDDLDCDYRTATFYARNTGIWGSLSAYKYTAADDDYEDCLDSTDCQASAATRYARVAASLTGTYGDWTASCTDGPAYRCQTYYKYACSFLLASKTVYSTARYDVGTVGPCGGSYKVTARTAGFRQAAVRYATPADSAYTATSCTDSNGYFKCFRRTMYALRQRSWSGWSGYSYTSCSDTSAAVSGTTYACRGRAEYSYRHRTWSAFGPWQPQICTEDGATRCLDQKFYSLRRRQWSDWMGWTEEGPMASGPDTQTVRRWRYQTRAWLDRLFGETVPVSGVARGSAPYYRYRGYTMVSKQVEISKVAAGTEHLGTREMMTQAQIMELSSRIGQAAVRAAIIQQLGPDLDASNFEAVYGQMKEQYADVGRQASQRFLTSKIFTPYVYVTDHWRATRQPFTVRTFSADWNFMRQYVSQAVGSAVGRLVVSMASPGEVAVIYFDPHDPLATRDTLPANWQGHKELLDAIRLADTSSAPVVVTLTAQDVAAIQRWLASHGTDDPIAFLRAFRHVFTKVPAELSSLLGDQEGQN